MIKAAMVGLGRWGQTILAATQGKSDKIRFVRGVSQDPDHAKIADAHGLRFSADLADAIADPEVEAVFLATPHSLHLRQVQQVAKAGKPVWCEKPLSLTVAEATQAIDACRAAGVPLGTGTNKRCYASMRELRRLIAEGAIGEILHIEGHYSNENSTRVRGGWRDDPNESPAAGMTGGGLHTLDAFVSIAGPIREIDARLFSRKPSPDPRDVVAVLATFESGVTGLMATVRASPVVWRVQVFGTNGYVEAQDEDTVVLAQMGKKPQSTTYPHVDPLRALVEAFADTVAHGTPFPITPPQILDMVGAFEAIVASVERREPVLVGTHPYRQAAE
jgi:predicted dehydrogenase